MPRGFKNKVRRIEVQPVAAEDRRCSFECKGSNEHAHHSCNDLKSLETRFHEDEVTNRLTAIDAVAQCVKMQHESRDDVQDVLINADKLKSHIIEQQKNTNPDEACDAVLAEVKGNEDEIEAKTEKKKKKKRKKKKKVKNEETTEPVSAQPHIPQNEDSEIEVVEENINEKTPRGGKCSKLPCLFGFISTWWAKRKERRRQRKQRAIAARTPTPVPQLVECEHKKSKGGESYYVEVDSRPMRKAVLPPIKPRTTGITSDVNEKMKLADAKRSEELNKKKKSSQEHATKMAECHERKADIEFYYKQKVDLTILDKQSRAKRNRKRIQEDRGCPISLLRAPSTLPPLRIVRVKPYAADGSTDPDEGIFDI